MHAKQLPFRACRLSFGESEGPFYLIMNLLLFLFVVSLLNFDQFMDVDSRPIHSWVLQVIGSLIIVHKVVDLLQSQE